MAFGIVLPNPFDPEDEEVTLETDFETIEEAIEWAATMFDVDEDGKITIIREYLESDDSETELSETEEMEF